MNLNITFAPNTPDPSCGYVIDYRRKPSGGYTSLPVSAVAAATQPIQITGLTDGNYEGKIYCDCCENQSTDTPFGINCWNPTGLFVAAVEDSDLLNPDNSQPPGAQAFLLIVESQVKFTVPMRIQGSFDMLCPGGTQHFTFNYVVNPVYTGSYAAVNQLPYNLKDSSGFYVPVPCMGSPIANIVWSIAPEFNAKILQSICMPYVAETTTVMPVSGDFLSGVVFPPPPVWGGCPTDLPSFTLDYDNVAHTLTASWIQDTDPGSGCGNLIFDILDSTGTIVLFSSAAVPRVGVGLFSTVMNQTMIPGNVHWVRVRYTAGCFSCPPIQFGV